MQQQKNKMTFVVAGMPRGGTTFLYHNLQKHPEIYLPFRKEVNYFGTNFNRGIEWYEELYKDKKPHQIKGDISPPYFLHDEAAIRMKAYCPNIKVILVLRDPVEWALSFYEQFKVSERNLPSFEDFVMGRFSCRLGDEDVNLKFTENYALNRVKQYSEIFGRNLLLYDFNFFTKERRATLKTLESFLGLNPYFGTGEFDDVPINASNRKGNWLINYLLSRELTITMVNKLFPRKLIVKARSRFDKLAVRSSQPSDDMTDKAANRKIAEDLLGEQKFIFEDLFKVSPFILGDGSPLNHEP